MKLLWYKRSKCPYEPSPIEKRRILLKSYTFRLPHKKKPNIFGRKKKSPDDVFPDDFQYRSTCKRRSYKLSRYFAEYLEMVEPPETEQKIEHKTTVMTKSGIKDQMEKFRNEIEVIHEVDEEDYIKQEETTNVAAEPSETDPVLAEVKNMLYIKNLGDLKKMREMNDAKKHNLSKQIIKRRRKDRKSSTLWSVASMDVLMKKGMIHEGKMEELYRTKLGPTMFLKEEYDPLKIYNWGEKGSGLHTLGPVQDFRTIRAKCFSEKVLFEDPYFPAKASSIAYSRWKHDVSAWKRPKELCKDPKLFVDGASRFDVQQGSLGNCWMLASLCSLTMKRKLFFQVVPLDQAFDAMYAGVFHFRLWNDGKWVDVVIDDRLPVNSKNKLCFVKTSSRNEFWPALLEKAYAKLQGTYEHIESGLSIEALLEFTGGLIEVTRFFDDPESFTKMKDAWDRDGLICLTSKVGSDQQREEKIPEGLILGHSYTVTKVLDATFRTTHGPIVKEKLLRIRNPWGTFEWNGAWSERSHEWFDVPERVKKDIGLKISDDGEFWMAFRDVIKYFSSAHICHVSPALQSEGESYILSLIEGEWVKGITAGGGRDSYSMNPQYLLKVHKSPKGKESTHVIISLLAKNRRRLKHLKHTYISMNISTFPIKNGYPRPLPALFFKTMHSLEKRIVYEPSRGVTIDHNFAPGMYVVVPSSWNQAEGEYILRFYSEEKVNIIPYDQQIGIDVEKYLENYGVEIDQHSERADEKDEYPIEILFVDKDALGVHNRKELLDRFLSISGKEEVINWMGLQSLLHYALETIMPPRALTKNVCRSLIALHDTSCLGAMNLVAFFILWTEIIFWVQIFNRYKDKNNEMGLFTLRDAIYEAGFRSNMHLLNLIMHRYGSKKGTLDIEDFLMVVIKFKCMMGKYLLLYVGDAFEKKMHPRTKSSKFTLSEFFALTMYC